MKAFRCSRTGLLYPADYIEEWGRKYGIGLGPEPISEALVNDYHRKPVEGGEVPMHGVGVCRSQIDLIDVTEAEFEAGRAVLAIDDPKLKKRGEIMFSRQIRKSNLLRNMVPALAAAADAEDLAKKTKKTAA